MGAALVVVLIALGALAVGVLLGRYYVPDDRMLRRSARHGKAYLRALSHQIARDHETVIAELRRVVDDNVDDSEPYFALGALFRSKGEHERAIRVHQALAVREAASSKLRLRALYELGLDFRAAGMPKRAGKALEEVLVAEPRHEGALRALCGLYEEQGRFAEAAAAWERLARQKDEATPRRHHHLLCAAAQRAIADGDPDSARRLLKDARARGGESAHFLVAASELAAARKDARAARARLCQALTTAPELVAYLAPALAAADRELSDGKRDRDGKGAAVAGARADAGGATPDDDGLGLGTARAAASLAELATSTGNPHLALAAALAAEKAKPDEARRALEQVAADAPTYLPARIAAARLALAAGDAAVIRGELQALTSALAWAEGTAWRCAGCGHRLTSFGWRCPACRRWATLAPEVGRHRVDTLVVAPRERRAEPRRPLLEPASSAALPSAPGPVPVSDAALAEPAAGPTAAPREAHALALPTPTLAHGLTRAELDRRASRPSVLGRVGGWISHRFRRR
jgi:lipopolysaccharide biosynthesis regulator YciM